MIDAEGGQAGVVPLSKALQMAEIAELDLVEISPNAEPPVCKILNYGKYRFQMQKKAAEARKNQIIVNVKEISIRPQTEEHDYQIKLKNMRKFIEKGDKVKVNLRFRGREITHKEIGIAMLDRMGEDMKDIAKIDQRPKMEGRQLQMLLSPIAPPSSKKK